MNKLPPCDHDCCPPTHCELDRLKADNAKLRDLLEPVQPRRKWRPIPRVSYTNFRKLYPQSQGFKRWLVAERFWRKRLWVIGIRHHIVKIDWRRDWVRDMFESELDLESLMPKSQHNDILDMVRRTEVEPLKAENARLRGGLGTAIELLDRYSAAVHCLSLDREPEVEEQVKRLREVYQSNPEQSILSAAVEQARGGPTPPKEYQGFA